MKAIKSLFLAVSLCIAALSSAQTSEAPAEIKSLDWMIGEWTAAIKWSMMGMNADGPITWKVEKEGPFMKQSTVMEMLGSKMTESSYLGWDAKKKKYWMHSYTNFAPTPRIEWGEQKGDVMILISDPWEVSSPTGAATVSRSTMTRKGEEVHFVLEFKNGEKWDKVGEGVFKKKK